MAKVQWRSVSFSPSPGSQNTSSGLSAIESKLDTLLAASDRQATSVAAVATAVNQFTPVKSTSDAASASGPAPLKIPNATRPPKTRKGKGPQPRLTNKDRVVMSGWGYDPIKAAAHKLPRLKFPHKGPNSPPPPKPTTFAANRRRFFAQRRNPKSFADAEKFAATLPLTIGAAFDAANADVGKSLFVLINPNRTVTVFSAPEWLTADYDPFFPLLTNLLNSSLPVGDNLFNLLSLAPSNTHFVVHGLLTYALPDDPIKLAQTLTAAVKFSSDASIAGARFLNQDPAVQALKPSPSVVFSVLAADLLPFTGTIVVMNLT